MLVENRNRNRSAGGAKRFRRTMIVMVALVVCVFAAWSYVNDYYKASEIAKDAMKGSADVEVVESKEYYCFLPDEGIRTGESIIFYPGGKVEETAYAPLMMKLAKSGYEVYLMRMPARLAVFKPDAASVVINREESETETGSPTYGERNPVQETDSEKLLQPGSRRWILMGHSLGGAMAARYAAEHSGQVKALVLLASYSTADLSDSGVAVLSLYGSEDTVMNRAKYEKYRMKLPDDVTELVIDGGNHAGFGFYGEQKGDAPATISREEQQEVVVDLLNFLRQE